LDPPRSHYRSLSDRQNIKIVPIGLFGSLGRPLLANCAAARFATSRAGHQNSLANENQRKYGCEETNRDGKCEGNGGPVELGVLGIGFVLGELEQSPEETVGGIFILGTGGRHFKVEQVQR
jgi:hypothetical protein